MMPSPSQIIVFATPAFLLLIALEWGVSLWRGRNAYRLADAVSSISLGMLSQTSAVFTQLLRIGLYTLAFDHVALWRNDAFWTSIPGWLLALLLYDFCYYWLHRMGHERSEEHTSELQSHLNLVCRLLLEKKKNQCKSWTAR